MNSVDINENKNYWFVGASFGGTEDQTERFIKEGVWEVNNSRQADLVKSIQPGEKIAIKSAYTRKNNLPFDSRGLSVSVMAIKAIGTVVENLGDGKTLKVDWDDGIELREWYFYTGLKTVWKVAPDEWRKVDLIDFAFNGKEQNIDKFRNHPYWRERFGDSTKQQSRFNWARFYEAFASKLLEYRYRREELIAGIHKISERITVMSVLNDEYEKGVKGGPLKDICPFTVFALFNRGLTDENRQRIAQELADFIGVSEPIPTSFDGIPIVNNQSTWFFGYSHQRQPDDIDNLWEVFAQAISYADLSDEANSEKVSSDFAVAYDKAMQVYGVGWNLTMALYWIRPWSFLTLDSQSKTYINHKLNIPINTNGPNKRCTSKDYLEVMDKIESRFQEDSYPVHSFPELSFAAYQYKPQELDENSSRSWKEVVVSKIKVFCRENNRLEFTFKEFLERFMDDFEELYPNNNSIPSSSRKRFYQIVDDGDMEYLGEGTYVWLDDRVLDDTIKTVLADTYSIDQIINDGCFLEKIEVEKALKRLRTKKNIILQGPPGTGKTWLAKRLAFALIGQKDDSKIRAVQFHPNLSYEDFIRGWRPSGAGKLELIDGPFMEMIKTAIANPDSKYVLVIEEINRGNPAQIFGEMLTLLEADKRTPEEALELSYRMEKGERVYIPSNLYVIGTMNIADRSLALVDLALRRRFAFIDLEPKLGRPWREWLQAQNGINQDLLTEIEARITALNNEIAADANLGPQFKVGHSYVTPAVGSSITNDNAKEWFCDVVDTEIGPLLDEYWFDNLEKSQQAQKRLIEGLL